MAMLNNQRVSIVFFNPQHMVVLSPCWCFDVLRIRAGHLLDGYESLMRLSEAPEAAQEIDVGIEEVLFSGWWFGTFVIFHNMWNNPSH